MLVTASDAESPSVYRKHMALLAAIMFAAQACTDSEPAAPAAGGDTVFDPMVDTIDEAGQVDDLARSRMDTLNDELEQSEGGRDP